MTCIWHTVLIEASCSAVHVNVLRRNSAGTRFSSRRRHDMTQFQKLTAYIWEPSHYGSMSCVLCRHSLHCLKVKNVSQALIINVGALEIMHNHSHAAVTARVVLAAAWPSLARSVYMLVAWCSVCVNLAGSCLVFLRALSPGLPPEVGVLRRSVRYPLRGRFF
jgi:hypothetical protein